MPIVERDISIGEAGDVSIGDLQLVFLPTVLRNCWTGWIACSSSIVRQLCRFDVVKSAYTRLTLAGPSDATSERISPITSADGLSASIRTARRRKSSGILYSPPLVLTAYLALRLSSNNRSADSPRKGTVSAKPMSTL